MTAAHPHVDAARDVQQAAVVPQIQLSIVAPSENFRNGLAQIALQVSDLVVLNTHYAPFAGGEQAKVQPPEVVLIGIPRLVDTPMSWKHAREARLLWPLAGVIAVGGEPSTATHDLLYNALLAGVRAWISYPMSPHHLGQTVRAVAAGAHPLDELITVEPLLVQRIADKLRTTSAQLTSQHEFLELSAYELAVLDGIACGLSHKQIAYAMGIKVQTAKNHASSLYRKLGVRNRTSAMLAAVSRGGINT
jgi:DNA-binding NarL/FixJ family response regulator